MNPRTIPLGICILTAALFLTGCPSGATNDCNDGNDNDSDGLVDTDDPGCDFNGDAESPDPDISACSDAVDNDGDGLIDTEDPGCLDLEDDDEYNEPIAACKDGLDNDGDGKIDFPNDPGCGLTLEDDESDDCPDGPNCPACADGVDNDGDEVADYPDDLGCDSSADDDEFNADPSICGANVSLQPLPGDGIAAGQVNGDKTNELISASCGGSGEETVYIYEAVEPVALLVTTDFPETTLDTVVYVRTDCRSPASELGCNDDSGINVSTLLLERLEPGEYYIVVDAHNQTSVGAYRLEVTAFTPKGESCTDTTQCTPGLVCRPLTDGDPLTCENPRCSDGLDNDGDLLIDYPEEPGCQTLADNDETDSCPSGGDCPLCSNDQDDDGDLITDYPDDPGCSAASDNNEVDECIPGVEVIPLDNNGAAGTTSGTSHFTQTCAFSTTAPEDVYAYLLQRDDLLSLTFSTVGSAYDTVLSVRYDDCGSAAAQIDCQDPGGGGEDLTIDAPDPGSYYVFVDGAFGAGSYVLDVEGILPPNAPCTPGDPGFICAVGYTCRTSTCVQAQCADGNSNDADGLVDYPNDPGCENPSDDSEADDCPSGPNCPECGNGQDDDVDGKIDYGTAPSNDPGCTAASDDLELDECSPGVLLTQLTDAGAAGTTPPSGSGSDFNGSCNSSTLSTEDEFAYRNTRNLSSLTFSTVGSAGNTVLYVRNGECSDPNDEVGCANATGGGEAVTITDPVQNDFYYVFVDGSFVSGIDYVLNVSGTIAPTNSCVVGNTQFTCEAGYWCNAGTCAPTQCNDGANNQDNDGFVDFPNDPGCTDISDNSEADDCPNGPNCPQCGNNDDDDGDGLTDYDDDPGCEFAADNLELDDCISGVPVKELTDNGATGTTPPSGSGSDFSPTCHSSTLSTEDEYAYRNSRNLTSLTFSTVGSSGDTVLYVRYPDCGDIASELDCANIQNGGETVTVSNPVTNDYYFVFVDGDFTSGINYVLDVQGKLALDETCSPANTQFVCDSSDGLICSNGTCRPAQCSDGINNDGGEDNLIDFADPGCSSAADNTESPNPGSPPECFDNLDNDGDGETDYPDDLGCQMASDDLEESCNVSDTVVVVNAATINGTTAGQVNDTTPSCVGSSTAPDIAHELYLPGDLSSLSVDTNGSGFDTVLYIKKGECNAVGDVGCNDDGGTGSQSLITLGSVPAGLYYIMVDGWSSNSGAYTLHINGVIASGENCDPAQISAGYLTCAQGTTCTGGKCQ